MLKGNGDIYYLNGNVGVGTTNPQVKLDVNGDLTADNIWIKVAGVSVNESTGHTVSNLSGYGWYKVVFQGFLSAEGDNRHILIRPGGVSTQGAYKSFVTYAGSSSGSDWDDTGFFVGRNGWDQDAQVAFEYTLFCAGGRQEITGSIWRFIGFGQSTFWHIPSGRILGFGQANGYFEGAVQGYSLWIGPSGGTISGYLAVFTLQ